MKSLFTFDAFWAPRFITVVHAVLQICVFVVFIGGSVTAYKMGSVSGFLSTLIVCTVGAVVARIVCELVLGVFRIYDVLRDIRRHGVKLQAERSQT